MADSTNIDGNKKNLIKAAVDARVPADGPRRPGQTAKKHAKTDGQKNEASTPPYVVAVTKREKSDEPSTEINQTYNPKELKAKARAFLSSPHITSEQRAVLAEILGDEKEEKPPKT